jgi:hypothetical protein
LGGNQALEARMAKSTAYETFMSAVLEPLPAEDLIDINYNKLVRADMWEKWRRAEVTTEFNAAALRFYEARDGLRYYTDPQEFKDRMHEFHRGRAPLVAAYRQSLAFQLITPAPDGEALRWKRAQFLKNKATEHGYHLPIAEARIRASIDQDEKFLAAHPRRRKNAREREQRA